MSITRQPLIIVVEDSDEDYDTVQQAAKQAGLSILFHRAVTGDECLDLLRGPTLPRPALVLMDLNTSGTDGRETLAIIKRDHALRDLPVVVLTTSNNPRELQFCYAAGANAYHVKPVRYSDHLALLVEVFSYWLRSVMLPDSKRQAP
jgi:CheY-like chemotaxis protein